MNGCPVCARAKMNDSEQNFCAMFSKLVGVEASIRDGMLWVAERKEPVAEIRDVRASASSWSAVVDGNRLWHDDNGITATLRRLLTRQRPTLVARWEFHR